MIVHDDYLRELHFFLSQKPLKLCSIHKLAPERAGAPSLFSPGRGSPSLLKISIKLSLFIRDPLTVDVTIIQNNSA